MAYDRDKIYKRAVKAIKKHKLFTITGVVECLPISVETFYQFFPLESEKSDTIKEMLMDNKVGIKSKLRKKWQDSDNATTQIALYKLVGNEEELERLSGQVVKVKKADNVKTIEELEADLAKLDDNLSGYVPGEGLPEDGEDENE